jgi:hypothetical protein
VAPQWRFYETTLVGEEGAGAGVISVPVYGCGWIPPAEVAQELGLDVWETQVSATELFPSFEGYRASANLAAELVYAPIISIDESPPIGRALVTIAWGGGGAALVATGRHPH